jgi:hypothetical protein
MQGGTSRFVHGTPWLINVSPEVNGMTVAEWTVAMNLAQQTISDMPRQELTWDHPVAQRHRELTESMNRFNTVTSGITAHNGDWLARKFSETTKSVKDKNREQTQELKLKSQRVKNELTTSTRKLVQLQEQLLAQERDKEELEQQAIRHEAQHAADRREIIGLKAQLAEAQARPIDHTRVPLPDSNSNTSLTASASSSNVDVEIPADPKAVSLLNALLNGMRPEIPYERRLQVGPHVMGLAYESGWYKHIKTAILFFLKKGKSPEDATLDYKKPKDEDQEDQES